MGHIVTRDLKSGRVVMKPVALIIIAADIEET